MVQDKHDNNIIATELTPQQRREVIIAVQILKYDLTVANPEVLVEEIICALLDPYCYPKFGNNFSSKLRAITQSIRDRTWKNDIRNIKDK